MLRLSIRGVHLTGTNLYSRTHDRLNTMKPVAIFMRSVEIRLNIQQR